MPQYTLVSSFFDLQKRQPDSQRPAALEKYMQWGKWLMDQSHPLILFTDPELVWMLPKTKTIVPIVLEETALYKTCFKNVSQTRAKNCFKNADPAKDTPLYTIVQWLKVTLCAFVSRWNPFGTTHVLWVDFGITHVANVSYALERLTFFSEKVVLHEMMHTLEEEVRDLASFFEYERGKVCGGCFSFPVEKAAWVEQHYYQCMWKAMRLGWAPNDQQLWAWMTVLFPDDFDFTFGDYSSCLSNAKSIRLDKELVLRNAAWCKQHGRKDHVSKIESFLYCPESPTTIHPAEHVENGEPRMY